MDIINIDVNVKQMQHVELPTERVDIMRHQQVRRNVKYEPLHLYRRVQIISHGLVVIEILRLTVVKIEHIMIVHGMTIKHLVLNHYLIMARLEYMKSDHLHVLITVLIRH